MVGTRVMFGGVISKIFVAWAPSKCKLLLFNMIFDPVETHINGFGTFLFEVVVDDAVGGAVVGANQGGRLGMAKFDEGTADGDGLLGIEVDSSDFRFRGGCHNVFDDLGKNKDGAVEKSTGGIA